MASGTPVATAPPAPKGDKKKKNHRTDGEKGNSSKNIEPIVEDGENEASPTGDCRRLAPVFVEEVFWELAKGYDAKRHVAEDSRTLLLQPRVAPEDGEIMDPLLAVRFAVDRGLYPWVALSFSNTNGLQYWSIWTDYILGKADCVDILKACGLYRAVLSFQFTRIGKSSDHLEMLVARWNRATHTFVTSWGEFTITLEDVMELTGLEIVGSTSYVIGGAREDHKAAEEIRGYLEACGQFHGIGGYENRRSFKQWTRYIFRDFVEEPEKKKKDGPKINSKHHLACYILMFLSAFILPGFPDESPCEDNILLAVRLARGENISLPPLVLGSLYHQLDMASECFERSHGRYVVKAFLPSMLLEAFVYEHFTGLRRRGGITRAYSAPPSRSVTWAGAFPGRRRLAAFIDDEDVFCFRPYTKQIAGCWSANIFPKKTSSMTQMAPAGGTSSGKKKFEFMAAFLVICSRAVPFVTGSEPCVMSYRVDRCARQLGYDVAVPTVYDIKESLEDVIRQFTYSYCAQHMSDALFTNLMVPSCTRETLCSSAYRKFWQLQLKAFEDFVRAEPTVVGGDALPLIGKGEVMLKVGRNVWKGTRSSFGKVMGKTMREHRSPKISMKMKGRREDLSEPRRSREGLEGARVEKEKQHTNAAGGVAPAKKHKEKLVCRVSDDGYATVSEEEGEEEIVAAPRRKASQVTKGKKVVVRPAKAAKDSPRLKRRLSKEKGRHEDASSSDEGSASSDPPEGKIADLPSAVGGSHASRRVLKDKDLDAAEVGVLEEESEKGIDDEVDCSDDEHSDDDDRDAEYSTDDHRDDEYCEVTDELAAEGGEMGAMDQETEKLEEESPAKEGSGASVGRGSLKRSNPVIPEGWVRSRRAFVRKVDDESSRTHARSGNEAGVGGDQRSKTAPRLQSVGASEIRESWVASMKYSGNEHIVLSSVELNFPDTFRLCTDISLVGKGMGSLLAGLISQLLCVTIAEVTAEQLKQFLCSIEFLESSKFQLGWLRSRVELVREMKFGTMAQERESMDRAVSAQRGFVEAARYRFKEAHEACEKARAALRLEEAKLDDLEASCEKLRGELKSHCGLTEGLEYIGDKLLSSLEVERE